MFEDNANDNPYEDKNIGYEFERLTCKNDKLNLPKECKTAGLSIVAFPTDKHQIKQRPNMEADIIPRHSSSCIFNGKSGSGKSQLLVNLMTRPEFYGPINKKHYFDIIYVFSPTANGGDDLIKFLKIPEKQIYTEFEPEDLDKIVNTQKAFIEKNGLLKSPKILVIFEDIQSNKKFMNSKSFLKCFIMARHLNISSFLMSQSWTRTPRACRLQANNIFFFPGSKSEHKLLVDEFNPPRLSKVEFNQLIDHATDGSYNFLHINNRAKPEEKFRKNLDEMLKLKT